jgi:hypothetical protein
MTEQELKELLAEIAKNQAETAALQAETAAQMKETGRRMAETDKQIKQVNKQLGELGNRLGGFTEGMAWPSMEKLLRQFGMNDVGLRRKFLRNGQTLEVDVFGWDNTRTRKEAYAVEVKSRLQKDAIERLLKTLAELPRFFSDLRDYHIYGVIAAVDIPENMRAEVLKRRLYLAQLADETFELLTPPHFKPQDYGPTARRNGRANGRAKKKTPRTK